MNPNDSKEDGVRALLKQAFAPVDTELRRDLWPAMLQRMDQELTARLVPWYDWLLAALVPGAIVLFPKLLVCAFHL